MIFMLWCDGQCVHVFEMSRCNNKCNESDNEVLGMESFVVCL